MLQELRIKNFLSFRDEVLLNFEATKDKMFEECQVVEVEPGVRLLRFAMLYGANASGKTNLLVTLDYLRNFWFEKREDIDQTTKAIPFLLDKETPHEPSEFEMKFYIVGTRFSYCLVLDDKRVLLEKLSFYRSERPTMLFVRKFQDGRSVVKINPAVVKINNSVVDELSLKCLPNMSFFAARNQVNCSIPIIDEARDWMKTKFLPMITPNSSIYKYAENRMHNNDLLKEHMLHFVHQADFNITDIETNDKSNDIYFEHTVKNKRGVERYTLPFMLQSEGTRRTIGIEADIYAGAKNENFLLIDEMESSLHPDLVEFILGEFLRTKNRSQMLITTHYDPLLNTVDDLIRKDSVWFVEKGEDGNSELYSLVEFKGLSRLSSLQKSYRNGVFRAIPNIKN